MPLYLIFELGCDQDDFFSSDFQPPQLFPNIRGQLKMLKVHLLSTASAIFNSLFSNLERSKNLLWFCLISFSLWFKRLAKSTKWHLFSCESILGLIFRSEFNNLFYFKITGTFIRLILENEFWFVSIRFTPIGLKIRGFRSTLLFILLPGPL